MNDKTLKTLEFHKILEKISKFAFGQKAKEQIMELKPLSTLSEINDAIDKVEEADKLLFQYAINPSTSIDDVTDALDSASVLSTLTMGELLKIGRALRVARTLRTKI